MKALQIRPYAHSDREAVRRVCWDTAFMGLGAAFLYRDPNSWADMYTAYYTDREPETAWVVVTEEGRVVGYLLGCADTRRYESELRVALKHHLTRALWARPGTAGFWWRALGDAIRDLGHARPPVDFARYPAHLHLNLLPEARGQGMAQALIARFHEALLARGVPGVHGEILAANVAIQRVLVQSGYHLYGAPYPVPGFRSPSGERVQGQLVVRELAGSVG